MFFIKQIQYEQGKLSSEALWQYLETPNVVLHLSGKKRFFFQTQDFHQLNS